MKLLSGFGLFVKAYRATHREILVSVKLLGVVTMLFAVALYLAEHAVNADYTFWDALVWTFVKYVEDPADIVSSPATLPGQIIGTLVGVLGIAIFAVPAGLIGSGLMGAMDDEKREKELDEYYSRVCKAFRRSGNKSLRANLNTLPDKGGKALARLNFVPQRVPVARLQVRQGMNMKDIFEVCSKHRNVCLKNLAEATENVADEQFVVEMFPTNRNYGCCIDRHSRVTIVCPTGFSEVGIGWFGYYLSKFGGFNYICKSIEADPDEPDSYYNLSDEPQYNKMGRSEYTRKDREALRMLNAKETMRVAFLNDIKEVVGKDSWVIIIADHQKNSENSTDLHFSYMLKDGSQPTITDGLTYESLYQELSTMAKEEFGMECVQQSARYPLLKKNLAFRIRREGVECNAFVLRASTELVNFEEKRLVIALRMAQNISRILDNGKGPEQLDIDDFAATGFGYSNK